MSTNSPVLLGDFAEIVMGQAPPGLDCNKAGRGTVFVKAGEFDARRPLVREWTTKPLRFARSGDVLVCVVGATAGKINEAIDCAIGRSVAAVRPAPSKVFSGYLYHFLSTQVMSLRTKSQGLAQGVITREMLQQLPIPLPSITEQRRIAVILDKADELRAKRRTALLQLNELNKSIFIDLFGDPNTNPKEFANGNIEATVSNPKKDIRCGPFGTQLKVHELVGSGTPLLGIENVLDEGFNPEASKFLTARKAEELRAFDVMPGDVLVTRMGTIGRACVVPESFLGGRFSYHLFRIRPDKAKCLPEFLAATISKSGTFQAQLRAHAHGAIMSGLNTTDLKAVRFLMPPLKLQYEFVRQIAAVDKLKTAYKASLSETDSLFVSLQHRAFRGEL